MLRFQEAEYGGKGHLITADENEWRRLWRQQKRQQWDAMARARFDDVPARLSAQPSPETALIEAIDRQATAAREAEVARKKLAVAARKKRLDAAERKEAQKRRRRKRRLKRKAEAQ